LGVFCERRWLFQFLKTDGPDGGAGHEDLCVFCHGGVGVHEINVVLILNDADYSVIKGSRPSILTIMLNLFFEKN
jgi:hypothetical protein